MDSLDVDSLLTNIPLDETIDICVNQLFENMMLFQNFKQLLCLATKSLILYLTVYKPIDGVAMGSPLRPSLANVFLSYHEKIC